ncbi:hypothetical protein ACI2JA_11255 [Alkalihalobacillus sp. NPDC078783]
MKRNMGLVKGFVFVGTFFVLFIIATNLLDLFFGNRQLTILLSILAFFLVILGSVPITKIISEWLNQQLR